MTTPVPVLLVCLSAVEAVSMNRTHRCRWAIAAPTSLNLSLFASASFFGSYTSCWSSRLGSFQSTYPISSYNSAPYTAAPVLVTANVLDCNNHGLAAFVGGHYNRCFDAVAIYYFASWIRMHSSCPFPPVPNPAIFAVAILNAIYVFVQCATQTRHRWMCQCSHLVYKNHLHLTESFASMWMHPQTWIWSSMIGDSWLFGKLPHCGWSPLTPAPHFLNIALYFHSIRNYSFDERPLWDLQIIEIISNCNYTNLQKKNFFRRYNYRSCWPIVPDNQSISHYWPDWCHYCCYFLWIP